MNKNELKDILGFTVLHPVVGGLRETFLKCLVNILAAIYYYHLEQ